MNTYRNVLAQTLEAQTPLEREDIDRLLAVPQDSANGHFTLPCFSLAKSLKKSPKIIAEELVTVLSLPTPFIHIEAVNGYLNFFLDTLQLSHDILSQIALNKSTYGHSVPNGRNVIVDYSSPNIGKQLAFHHLRSTMIGNSLYRTYKAAGFNTTGINHLGDWGTQFGKLIVMYLRSGKPTDEATLNSVTLDELNQMYVAFSKIAAEHPELEDEARLAFSNLEAKEPLHIQLWEAFKAVTMKELISLYEMMNVSFDSYTGESFFNDHLESVIDVLTEKGLMSHSQERDVVILDQYDMPPCLIRKSDGSSLYATRDFAAARYRAETYNFEKCLYIVDNGQNLHFKQVFKVLELCGYDWAKGSEHVPFGLILHWDEKAQKWSKGSSKMGNSSTLKEVFFAARDKIMTLINEKNPDLANKEDIALKIGISALVFNDLKSRRLGDVKFDWDKALSFEGDTGPYVQNAHVRLCSIMRKAGRTVQIEEVNFEHIQDPEAYELILILSQLSKRIIAVTESNEPCILTQYSLHIAEAAHRFIHHCRILGSEQETARLFLAQCTQQVLENTLTLLGVSPIREM